MPGQYGGFLGSVRDPFLIEGDPSQAPYQPLSLGLPDGMNSQRLGDRLSLSTQLDSAARLLEAGLDRQYDRLQQSALDLVVDGRVRKALDLGDEPAAMRDRYGRTKIGQSLLVARRLVEAGVQYVAYNAFNQEWDTHGGLGGSLQATRRRRSIRRSRLWSATWTSGACSIGTLVVNTGEFGRTPQVNKDGGRDHWPNAYSTVVAGGGPEARPRPRRNRPPRRRSAHAPGRSGRSLGHAVAPTRHRSGDRNPRPPQPAAPRLRRAGDS